MEITLSNGWLLQVPDGYEKKPLAILNEWVEALRSGKYKQGQELLKTKGNRYCCLGVLCDIEGAKWQESSEHFEAFGMHAVYKGTHNVTPAGDIRPCSVNADIRVHKFLSGINDAGLSFNDIATVLEHVYVQTT